MEFFQDWTDTMREKSTKVRYIHKSLSIHTYSNSRLNDREIRIKER